MKRKVLAVLLLGVIFVGCAPSLTDRSYSVARDGAQKALSLTFSLAAAVTNWLPETPEKPCPHCPKDPHSAGDPGVEAPDVAI
ncbi:MAG TPA: hypothetical protein VGS07_26560 [Thermoanaerobaculia bacterium]|jgi:hypothetical protein|nr:hypothetical protein [Thermoanaerobaculia bacterium]